jgi:hypothetical protein
MQACARWCFCVLLCAARRHSTAGGPAIALSSFLRWPSEATPMFGDVLVGGRPSEIGEDAVAHELRQVTFKATDHRCCSNSGSAAVVAALMALRLPLTQTGPSADPPRSVSVMHQRRRDRPSCGSSRCWHVVLKKGVGPTLGTVSISQLSPVANSRARRFHACLDAQSFEITLRTASVRVHAAATQM